MALFDSIICSRLQTWPGFFVFAWSLPTSNLVLVRLLPPHRSIPASDKDWVTGGGEGGGGGGTMFCLLLPPRVMLLHPLSPDLGFAFLVQHSA